MFALFLYFTGSGDWSWREYFEFVTENIEPFPEISLSVSFDTSLGDIEFIIEFLRYIWSILSYPIKLLVVVFHNVQVIFMGFFPVVIEQYTESLAANGSYVRPSIWEVIFPTWLVRWF